MGKGESEKGHFGQIASVLVSFEVMRVSCMNTRIFKACLRLLSQEQKREQSGKKDNPFWLIKLWAKSLFAMKKKNNKNIDGHIQILDN